jgi:hypothetical protein
MSENGFRFATGLGMPLLLTMYRPFCSTTRVLFRARARLLDAASPFHLSMSSNTDITKSFSTEVEDGLLACRAGPNILAQILAEYWICTGSARSESGIFTRDSAISRKTTRLLS